MWHLRRSLLLPSRLTVRWFIVSGRYLLIVPGLLLQNAITTIPSIHTNNTIVRVGIKTDLPPGFSADLFDGSFSSYGDIFGMATTFVDGDDQGAVDNTYVNGILFQNAGGCGGDDLVGTCTGNVVSPGFDSSCTTSTLPYDLSPKNHDNQPFSGTAYSVKIDWNITSSNVFNLTVVAKGSNSCVGNYTVRHCTFRAAQMSYPIELFPATQLGPNSPARQIIGEGTNCLSLNANSSWKNDKFISYLPDRSELVSSNSTFGGLVHYLQSTYEADLIWSWNGSVWSTNATGKQARNAILDTSVLDPRTGFDVGNRSLASPDYCASKIYNVLDGDDDDDDMVAVVEYAIRDRIRNLMFFSSIMEYGFNYGSDSGPAQQVQAERKAPELIYKILYRYWVASLAVTSS